MPLTGNRKIILIAVPILVLILATVLFFFRKEQVNPVTGKPQHISLTPDQEIELGLESSPQLAAQFGGISRNDFADEKIKIIGRKLISSSDISKSPYQFDFHVLADSQSVAAFAFPGGQIFVTMGLFKKLKTDNQIAVILSHQIGHVIGRHAVEKLFKSSIFEGIINSDTVAVSDFPPRLISKYLSDFIALDYNELEENEADALGLSYINRGGFSKNSFLQDFVVTGDTDKKVNLFFDKHPNFENRKEKLGEALRKD